ncbi:methyltransferase domain-containing protein [Campylobacter sp.]|uniref:methyltransferase domain-containing protein n=1 Tax=Campylobacter sp. TaxID=205 RepID=UPI0026DAFFA7|nr:methyltransferase domain-containing protein [Campylobacter sp.]MDO4674204.1 methyltransferase domain-containing protein [Campylobacter sp.]
MNFLKAKQSYSRAALVQNLMGNWLCKSLQNTGREEFERVFEFGCGQGEFTQKLQKIIRFKSYVKNDILDYGEDLDVQIFDMNAIATHPLSRQKFDLIASNASLQWLSSDAIFPPLAKMLAQNGLLLLSSFLEDNFKEIRQSTGFGLDYLSFQALKNKLEKHFEILHLEEQKIPLRFESALELFRYLKLSGVNSLGFYPLTKAFLREFERRFQNRLTHHIVLILCQKSKNL